MNRLLIATCMASAVYAAAGLFLYRYIEKGQREEKLFLIETVFVFCAALLSLQLGSYSSFGDAGDFEIMLKRLGAQGFAGIYGQGDIQYPPLFWYLYYGVYRIMRLAGIPVDAGMRAFVLGIKLPCILTEFLVTWLLCRCTAGERGQGRQVLLCWLILLNPGVLFTTGFVCQVDMLYIGAMAGTVYLLVKKRLIPAYFCFAAAVLLKLQAVFITPLVLAAAVDQVIFPKDTGFSWKNFRKNFAGGLAAVGLIFAAYLPMMETGKHTGAQSGFFTNLTNSMQSFGKASQNACNFWMLAGYNQVPAEETFGPLACRTWSILFLVLVVAVSLVMFIRRQGDISAYPLCAAFLTAGTYTFAVKMMSRYLYPVVFFLSLAYALRPTKTRFRCAIVYSALYILVVGTDYLVYPWMVYEKSLAEPYLVSAAVVACFGYLAWMVLGERQEGHSMCGQTGYNSESAGNSGQTGCGSESAGNSR